MMRACRPIGQTEVSTRDFGHRVLPRLAAVLLVFLVLSFGISLERHLQVIHCWIERPALIGSPLAGLVAAVGIAWGWKMRHYAQPLTHLPWSRGGRRPLLED